MIPTWDSDDHDISRVSLEEVDVGVVANQSIRVRSKVWVLTVQLSLRPDSKFLDILSRSLLNIRLQKEHSGQPVNSSTFRRRNHFNSYQPHVSHFFPPLPPVEFPPASAYSSPYRKKAGEQKMSLKDFRNLSWKGIRPGFSLRIIRAEIGCRVHDHAEYVIHIVDLNTGVFWNVKKRFREFFALRKELKRIVRAAPPAVQHSLKYLNDLPFPRRRIRSANSQVILRRQVVLEAFLRNIAALEATDPCRRAVLTLFQSLFCSAEFISSLERIDVSMEPLHLKWLQLDLFRTVNSWHTPEGQTCQKFISAFRNRVAVAHAALSMHQQSKCRADKKTIANEALTDLRHVITSIGNYIVENLDDAYITEISAIEKHADAQNIINDLVYRTVEDTMLVPLQEQMNFLVGVTIEEAEESSLNSKISALRGKSQTYFGIPQHLQSDDNWGKAIHHLRCMDDCGLPIDKLKELMASANCIFVECGDGGLECSKSALSADDFLPIHIYVVVHSGLRRPLLTKELLGAMIHPSKMAGEVGYFLTMFEVALKYIYDLVVS